MYNDDEINNLFNQSRFIFRGKVIRTGITNVQLLPPSDNTVVVGIEQILHSSEELKGHEGHMVTVVLNKKGVDAGKTYLFFCNGFLYGENIAVREVGRIEWSPEILQIANRVSVLHNLSLEHPLKERIDKADIIVVGTVTGLKSANSLSKHKSEHDPDWWIANVLVFSVEKGPKTMAGKTIEVLFSNSRDISWYQAPKLHPGIHSILILRKEKIKEVEGEFFLAIHPLDLQLHDRLQDIRRTIGGKP